MHAVLGASSAAPGDEKRQFSAHSFGAVFAKVLVDPELGTIKVPRIVGVAAALANAVYHATGKRVRDLPIRLDQIIDH